MKKILKLTLILICSSALLPVISAAEEGSPFTPCIDCHLITSPGVVKQWGESKHSKVGIKCYVCHMAKDDDPSGFDHEDFRITAIVTPKTCDSCHPKEVREFREIS